MIPTILDCEATGLTPQTLPIQIAFNIDKRIESFYINIFEGGRTPYWDIAAEHIHRISKETLVNEGISVGAAALIIKSHFDAKTIYSDAPRFEKQWIDNLFKIANIEADVKFHHIAHLAYTHKFNKELSIPMEQDDLHFFDDFETETSNFFIKNDIKRHGAGNDVAAILNAYTILSR